MHETGAATPYRLYHCLRLCLVFLAAYCGLWGTPGSANAQEPAAKAQDARIGGDATRTRFVADLSKPVDFTVRTLPDPYRVIVDLPDVNFQMPEGLGSKGRGLVTAFRFGNFAKGKSRIVIDVTGPVIVEKAFVRPPGNNQPARLVLDMVKTTRDDFLARQAAALELEAIRKQAIDGLIPPLDLEVTPESGAKTKTNAKPVIVLDPGHGGIDPGTNNPQGVLEKSIVLAFCFELKRQLEETGRFKVLLTRDTDTFIALTERTNFARANNADLFISIHADAIDAKHPLLGASGPKIAAEVRGASIYTLNQQASDAQAQASAARENLSDVIAGLDEIKGAADDVSNILADLVQRAAKNEAREFSNIAIGHLKERTLLTSKPQRFANFIVLRAPDVPSVLIELGYLSNPDDEKQLVSPEWRAKVAEALRNAVSSFFSRAQGRLPF